MIRRRWRRWGLAGALVLLTCAASVVILLPPRPGISRANYNLIREGMTRAEVETVFGGPPGNYSQFPDREAGLWAIDPDDPALGRPDFIGREVWIAADLAVTVWFDERQRAVKKAARDNPRRSFADRLRAWLGW
jgi:hypothetical protein